MFSWKSLFFQCSQNKQPAAGRASFQSDSQGGGGGAGADGGGDNCQEEAEYVWTWTKPPSAQCGRGGKGSSTLFW